MSQNADPIIASLGAPSIRRSGASAFAVLSGLVVLIVATGSGTLWLIRGDVQPTDDALVYKVQRGGFVLEVTEQGDLVSGRNIDIRCEVSARGGRSGVKILEIVPEGIRVKKGDFLIRLDSAELELELIKQQIEITNKEAELAEAENKAEVAVIALEEYQQGTLEEEQKTIEIALLKADENLARAVEYMQYSKKAYNKGVISKHELDADFLAVKTYEREKEMAEKKSEVLEEFTSKKKIKDLESEINTTAAKQGAAKLELEMEKQTLADIEEQMTKCLITAPAAGIVKYASEGDRRYGGDEKVVEEGREVYQRQLLIQLPDVSRMHVRLKVNESVIDSIQLGMRAKIKVVGIRDLELTGSVVSASQYSERASRYSGGVKEFLVEVSIDHPTAQLRTGMTAQVTIECKRLSDVLLIPVQALYAHGDQYFCIVNPKQPELLQVKPGITNDKLVVIQTGLEGGETVSLNPRHYFDQVELPKLAEKDDTTDAPSDRLEDRSQLSQNIDRQLGNRQTENRTGRQGRPPRNRPTQGNRPQRTKKPQASGSPLAIETSQQQKDDATVETASSDTAPASSTPSGTTAPAATESDR